MGNEDTIGSHEAALLQAFAAVLRAEEAIRVAKSDLQEVTARLSHDISLGELALTDAWKDVADLLAETGEFEATLPGTANDYRLYWSTPSRRVKVEPDAVPDEFCKIERKPKLKEIGDYLKGLPAEAMPNWGRFEAGESKLAWKAVKKSTT